MFIEKEQIHKLNENCELHIINIDSFSNELIQYFEDSIQDIMLGVKYEQKKQNVWQIICKTIHDRLTKQNNKISIGYISELFIHLIMKEKGFKQEFIFKNLEENSLKKGFDGLYSDKNLIWIMESKASSIYDHPNNLTKAIMDLKKKIETEYSNNPWANAYNHVQHRDVGAKKNIRDMVQELCESYELQQYEKLNEFNIICASTIFIITEDIEELIPKIKKIENKFEGKNNIVLCVSNTTKDNFINYIKDNINEQQL